MLGNTYIIVLFSLSVRPIKLQPSGFINFYFLLAKLQWPRELNVILN